MKFGMVYKLTAVNRKGKRAKEPHKSLICLSCQLLKKPKQKKLLSENAKTVSTRVNAFMV